MIHFLLANLSNMLVMTAILLFSLDTEVAESSSGKLFGFLFLYSLYQVTTQRQCFSLKRKHILLEKSLKHFMKSSLISETNVF